MSELLTVDEVARECRVHPVTIRRLIAAGKLHAVRIGRHVRVRREDITAMSEEEAMFGGRPKTGILEDDDPLVLSIGSIEDDATDVSENKYKYLYGDDSASGL